MMGECQDEQEYWELEEELLGEVRQIRGLFEQLLIRDGVVPESLEERVVEEVMDNGSLSKQEIKTLLDVADEEALELMKNLDNPKARYVPGYGNRESRLYYTGSEIAQKAADLISMMDRASSLEREEAIDRLDIEPGQLNGIVKLAKKFTSGKVQWDHGTIKKFK